MLNSNETIYLWHKREIGQHRVGKPFSLNGFYPYGRQLMFTQPFESLNKKRIKHYEELIKTGERPLAISLREHSLIVVLQIHFESKLECKKTDSTVWGRICRKIPAGLSHQNNTGAYCELQNTQSGRAQNDVYGMWQHCIFVQ